MLGQREGFWCRVKVLEPEEALEQEGGFGIQEEDLGQGKVEGQGTG